MVDFRVHEGFPDHPKTLGLSLAAIGLWTIAGCWSARYLTDGYVPTEAMHKAAGRNKRAIDELVDHHLLQRIEGGYLFADWLQYQRSRSEVEKQAAHNRSRQAKFRATKSERTSDE